MSIAVLDTSGEGGGWPLLYVDDDNPKASVELVWRHRKGGTPWWDNYDKHPGQYMDEAWDKLFFLGYEPQEEQWQVIDATTAHLKVRRRTSGGTDVV